MSIARRKTKINEKENTQCLSLLGISLSCIPTTEAHLSLLLFS